jgi:hypothetical protein
MRAYSHRLFARYLPAACDVAVVQMEVAKAMLSKNSQCVGFNLTCGQYFTPNIFRCELIVATFLSKKMRYCAARNFLRCICVFALAKSVKLGITPRGRQPNESEWRCPWTFV